MNNTQQALSNDDPETIRRLQREWRIAKRKEIEDKKRKKKFRTLETPVIQDVSRTAGPQYITVQSNGVTLPHSSAANVHFQFQPHVVQGQPTASNPLFVNAMQVGGAPSHSQQHPHVDHADEKHRQVTQQHSVPNVSGIVQPRSQETVQYSAHHDIHSNPDPAQCSPSSSPHGMEQENPGSIGMSAGASQPMGSHYLSPARDSSTFTTLGEQKVAYVHSTMEAPRSTTDGSAADNSVVVGHGMTEETRRKIEIEEAQRRWRENKRKELAMKRARAASSKRGRKRTKLVHQHPIIDHPVQVVSTSPPLTSAIPFPTSSGVTSALPVSSALHNPGTNDQLQVSSSEIPSPVVRSMGLSVSDPISTSIAMSSPVQTTVPFPLSSVPIPSSVAVPVVPALTIQHVQSSNYGVGHDPDTGFVSLPLSTSHQFSNVVTPERVPQNGMNATAVNTISSEDGTMAVYEPLHHNTRDQPQTSGAPPSLPVAPLVCATDLIESRPRHNDVPNHIIERRESKLHSTAPDMGPSPNDKMSNEVGVQPIDEEGQTSRAEKDEADYVVQAPMREQSKDIGADVRATELDVRGTISTMEPEVQNIKPSPGSERTSKQYEEHAKTSEEHGPGKDFEDPQESFQEDGGDDLMNSVTWQSLGSIENP